MNSRGFVHLVPFGKYVFLPCPKGEFGIATSINKCINHKVEVI